MSIADEFLEANRHYAEGFDGPLPLPPSRKVAVVACMDARLDVPRMLGLVEGEAHVIRNAGGLASDDVLRSLAISQHLLGTREVVLVHHTDCGMLSFTDEDFLASLEEQTGQRPDWQPGSFTDLDEDVRAAARRIREDRHLALTESVRGFVFDVATGLLREVEQA